MASETATFRAEPSTPPADGDTDRNIAFEHEAKEMLREHGITTPRGAVVPITDRTAPTAGLAAAAAALRAPVVLKAWGPGLVHKSDVGAVRLGLDAESLPGAAEDMAARLREAGLEPGGWLVEEQHPGGVELIVGVVRDKSFGHVVLLGLGGIATELLDLSALRVAPLSRADAWELVDSFPGAPLLTGARGKPSVDREALVSLLLAIAGEGGLVSQLGDRLVEFECNPVVATPDGVTALDARLVTAPEAEAPAPRPRTDFAGLFAPRSIAVAGASTNKASFGNRFLAAYRGAGWEEGLYALHPSATEVDGVPAYPSVDAVPGGVDYLVVAVPAARVPDVVESAAGKARFIHVITGGFGEMGTAGRELEDRLIKAVRGTDTRLLGPNCLGVFSPAGRQTFTLGSPREPGVVSVVSQSGGLSGDMVTVGNRRGIRYSKLVSIGNAIDVDHSDLVEWLVDDPDTEVIGLYLEGAGDGVRLVRALRRASGRKPVVVLTGGSSRQGARAVSSHTGSMAGAPKVWKAVAEATGITLVRTLDEMLGSIGYLQRYSRRVDGPAGRPADIGGLLVAGLGGGASVLATDAADRAGLVLTPLRQDLRQRLRDLGYGAGTSVANPLEIPIGPVSPAGILVDALEPVLGEGGQTFSDLLVHVNVAAYYNYGTAGLAPLVQALRVLAESRLPVRSAVVLRNLDVAAPEDAEEVSRFAAEAGLQVFHSFDEAAVAIAAAQRFDRYRAARAGGGELS
ncbi:acetate--CoA ligase family protein [Streptomyces spiralis]|uniref:acetate--CoA ligase family protein n=1 Tax=Streptomyces spiralis TaxID=66376 RepID=UPI0033C3A32E